MFSLNECWEMIKNDEAPMDVVLHRIQQDAYEAGFKRGFNAALNKLNEHTTIQRTGSDINTDQVAD